MVIPRPTTRLLALLEVLQARDLVSGAELARRLEVNARSVRRYIAMLQEIGLPVETVRGPAGGYRLRPGYKLPPLMFTDEEAVALTLGLAGLARLGLALDPATVAGAQAKLERVLPATLRGRVQALEAGVALEPAPPTATAGGALVALLGQAAGDGRRVRLRYRSARSVSDRAVDPYGVAHWSRAWYLVGHCHLRGGTRLFRLDRILAAELLAETFVPPPDFDPYAYVARAMAAYPGQWPVTILLKMSLEEAQRSTLAAYGTLKPTSDGILYNGRFEDLDGLARWLILLRHPIVILEPPELRTALRALAHEVAALAEGAEEGESPMAAEPSYISQEEYLTFEREAQTKSEYVDGRVFAMVGACRSHNLLQVRLILKLAPQAEQRGCDVYPSDMRVKIPARNTYFYPDLTIVCGESQFEDGRSDTLLNPIVIIEILSPLTAMFDRTGKFSRYRQIASLKHYLLVAYDATAIEHFARQPDNQWLWSMAENPTDTISLTAVGCTFTLADIYANIPLSEAAFAHLAGKDH